MAKKNSIQDRKKKKLFESLFKTTEQFILGRRFKGGASKTDLMTRLGLPEQHEPIFHEILQELLDKKILSFSNGLFSRNEAAHQEGRITGLLHLHSRGFGFVQPNAESGLNEDIFIPKHLTQNAIDGDTVEVEVNTESYSEKGPEGKITAILQRSRTHVGGIIRNIDSLGNIFAYVPMLGQEHHIHVLPSPDRELKVGDRIVLEVVEWGAKASESVTKLSRYIGHILDPSCDIDAAVEEFQIRHEFSKQVREEATELGKTVSINEIKKREDLRYLEAVTIDPDTAKDFDDAVSLTKTADGGYELGVHIADVSAYVRPGTALDDEAQQRCNSTYFPGKCIPMLPSELSDNLCSLKPNVNRLTASILMDFDSSGTLINYRITRSVIKSKKRLSYKEAKLILDGKKKSSHAPLLHLMVELCQLLKGKRYERGSLEFSLPELVVLVNEKGEPTGTDYIAYDVTHQMIEEFMLKANETVATHLSKNGKNLTYRVHDVPAEENLRDFSVLAAAFGFKIADNPTPKDLQRLFEDASGTPYAGFLASHYIRRMRLATYSAENIGHYGLSLEYYCHFTSPIRRYVDLVVHRILFGETDDLTYLQRVALTSSERERKSAKAESSVVLLKKLRLLNQFYEKEPYKEYEAIVSKIKGFGLYFEVLDYMMEGFLHISELGDDYYVFEENLMRLKGRHSGELFSCGDKIKVVLKEIDLITLNTSWYIINKPKRVSKPLKKSGKGDKKAEEKKTEEKEADKPIKKKKVAVEKSKEIIKKPKKAVEKPKKIDAKPKKVVEKPKKMDAKPKKVVEKPKKIDAKPKKVVEKPKKATEKSKIVTTKK
jgi:ribonuclease R